jgi:cobalt/nickel transport system permease protein
MLSANVSTLWAVHISDGILTGPWLLGGFLLTAILIYLGSRRIADEEIPLIALLTAAFFIASLIRIPIGPTHVHLLLNGLVGVLLGWRAALAIPLALVLQAALFGHGGFTSLGVNACVMALPALASGLVFSLLRRLPALGRPPLRNALVAFGCFTWTLAGVFSAALLLGSPYGDNPALIRGTTASLALMLHPVTLSVAAAISLCLTWAEGRLENRPEFPLGLLVGSLAVLGTAALNCAVLIAGGERHWPTPALILLAAHLPVAVVEGMILGFAVGFLARVKPAMLGIKVPTVAAESETLTAGSVQVPALVPVIVSSTSSADLASRLTRNGDTSQPDGGCQAAAEPSPARGSPSL